MTEVIYILKLEGGKYYVGKTMNVAKRFQEHRNGEGSAWTNIHRPISVIETRPLRNPNDETEVTKELMQIYGTNNVRGGAFSMPTNLMEVRNTDQLEYRASIDACFKCGQRGHFAKDCGKPQNKRPPAIGYNQNSGYKPTKKTICYRCGRPGHYAPDCMYE